MFEALGSSSSFIPPEPPPWVDIDIPKQKFGSNFYNAGRPVANGAADFQSFSYTCANMFKFLSSSDKNNLLAKVDESVSEFKFEDYVSVDMSTDYVSELLGPLSMNEITALKNAEQSEQSFQNDIYDQLGGADLNKAVKFFKAKGVYDSQIFVPFLNGSNNIADRIKQNVDMIKTNLHNFVGGLSDSDVNQACDVLGVSNKTKDNLKNAIDDLLHKLSDLGKYDQSALDKLQLKLGELSAIPAINVSGNNVMGRMTTSFKEGDHRVQAERAREDDRYMKNAESKAQSLKKKEENELKQKVDSQNQARRNTARMEENKRR